MMEERENKECNEKDDLTCLKEKYHVLKEKYNLPEFIVLNKLFDIEDLSPETDFLLRKIRRTMSERVSGYSRFVDVILNPSNAPVFFFNVLKKLDSNDREEITKVYEILGNLELEMLSLDLDYSEEKEAEFIKKIVHTFDNDIRVKFLNVIKKMNNNTDKEKKDNNRSYFG